MALTESDAVTLLLVGHSLAESGDGLRPLAGRLLLAVVGAWLVQEDDDAVVLSLDDEATC